MKFYQIIGTLETLLLHEDNRMSTTAQDRQLVKYNHLIRDEPF